MTDNSSQPSKAAPAEALSSPGKDTLLPCPLCGSKVAICILEDEPGETISAWVACDCGLEIRERLTEAEAVKRWNTRTPAQGAMPPTNCDWPDTPFTFLDEAGEHDPCYVVMPGGAMLSLNHHATPGVDIARAKFIVDACNAALSPDFPRAAVAEAMQDAWNTICADTGCHPLDIKHRGKQLFFKPGHWVDLIALFLSRGDPSVSSTERHCEFCHVPMSSADCCDSEFESKGCPHSSPERGATDV